MRVGCFLRPGFALVAVLLPACVATTEVPVTPWFKMVRHHPRFEIPHIWGPGEHMSFTYRRIGELWEEIDRTVPGGSATVLPGDRVLYSSFRYTTPVIFRADGAPPTALPGCSVTVVSPSGDTIGCISPDRRRSYRVLKWNREGKLLDTHDYPKPDGFGGCSFYDLLFGLNDDRIVPVPHCESGYVMFDGAHWSRIDGLSSLKINNHGILDRLGLVGPLPTLE